MKVTVQVEDLNKIGYTHQVRTPNPDIHMLCLAGELSVVGVGTLKSKVKVGNGSLAKANPNVVQVSGLKEIKVSDDSIEIIGDNTIIIKELVKSNKKTTPSDDVRTGDKFGAATARPTKRVKKATKASE